MKMPDIALRPSMKFYQYLNGPVPPELRVEKALEADPRRVPIKEPLREMLARVESQ